MSLAGKGSTFRLTGEIVHVLRRADPVGWFALDDLAIQATYERAKGRVRTREGATDIERWTADIYNSFSTLRRRWGRHSGVPDWKHDREKDKVLGLRLHEAFQLAQACKKVNVVASSGAGNDRIGRRYGVSATEIERTLMPTMEALGFDVHGVEYLNDEDVRPNSYVNYGNPFFVYVNTGDTYTPAIGWDYEAGEWWFGSWGAWLEKYEDEHPEARGDDGSADEPQLIEDDWRAEFGDARVSVDQEHGQYWVTNLDTGAQWSVHRTGSGYGFEQVTEGDDS